MRSFSGSMARLARYSGALRSSSWLSNTVEGTKIRVRRILRGPSLPCTTTSSTMGVMGGAGVTKRSFTHP